MPQYYLAMPWDSSQEIMADARVLTCKTCQSSHGPPAAFIGGVIMKQVSIWER